MCFRYVLLEYVVKYGRYMAAVQFACIVKTGPLHEHSPMLNDISQVHAPPTSPTYCRVTKFHSGILRAGRNVGQVERRHDQDV